MVTDSSLVAKSALEASCGMSGDDLASHGGGWYGWNFQSEQRGNEGRPGHSDSRWTRAVVRAAKREEWLSNSQAVLEANVARDKLDAITLSSWGAMLSMAFVAPGWRYSSFSPLHECFSNNGHLILPGIVGCFTALEKYSGSPLISFSRSIDASVEILTGEALQVSAAPSAAGVTSSPWTQWCKAAPVLGLRHLGHQVRRRNKATSF